MSGLDCSKMQLLMALQDYNLLLQMHSFIPGIRDNDRVSSGTAPQIHSIPFPDRSSFPFNFGVLWLIWRRDRKMGNQKSSCGYLGQVVPLMRQRNCFSLVGNARTKAGAKQKKNLCV